MTNEMANPPPSRKTIYLRVTAIAVLIVALVVIRIYTSFGQHFSTAEIRTLALRSGGTGFAIYVGLFALGLFLHLPGLIFVAAGVLAWGHIYGALASYVGAFVGVNVTFVIVRAIGGTPFSEIRDPRMQKLLARLTSHPIASVAVVRTLLMATATTTYAFALSPIRAKNHFVGSALGLIPSVATMSAVFGLFIH